MKRYLIASRVSGLVAVLAIAGALALLTSVSPATGADMDDAAKVLARLDDDWSAAAATRNAEQVASFYAPDAIAYPPNEPMAIGRAAAQKVWAAYFADASFNISWKTLYAEVGAAGDLGFTSGTYEASYNGPDGKPVLEKGKYLCTWRKQKDGSWKATHDMWNSDAG